MFQDPYLRALPSSRHHITEFRGGSVNAFSRFRSQHIQNPERSRKRTARLPPPFGPSSSSMSDEIGAKALSGQWEFIHAKLFDAADCEKTIICRGKSISVFDPNADSGTEPYWEHHESTNAEMIVPKGHEVRVIAAHVRFEKTDLATAKKE